MVKYLLLGASFGLAAALQPGPFQAFLIGEAAKHGWRRTLPAAFAPLLSDSPIILTTVFVLSNFPVWFADWLRIAGAALALYIACGLFRTAIGNKSRNTAPPPRVSANLSKAVLVNLLNPNAWISWSLIMGPLLMQGWRESPGKGIALLAGFYGVLIPGTAITIALFGVAGQSGPRAGNALAMLSGLALTGFGAYLMWSGISGLAL